MTDQSILQEAEAIVNGERNESYGDATGMFQRIANLWTPILEDCVGAGGTPRNLLIEPRHVALCMIQLKIARETYRSKHDNRVDMAGYAELLDRVSAPSEAARMFDELAQNSAEQERLRSEIAAGFKVTTGDLAVASQFSARNALPPTGWWIPGDAFIYPSRREAERAGGGLLGTIRVRVWPREVVTDQPFYDRFMHVGSARVFSSAWKSEADGGAVSIPVRLIVEEDSSDVPESRL